MMSVLHSVLVIQYHLQLVQSSMKTLTIFILAGIFYVIDHLFPNLGAIGWITISVIVTCGYAFYCFCRGFYDAMLKDFEDEIFT